MATDAGPKTRPVRLEMHSRKDTDGVYSQFVYQKGAAMLVMLDGWLGEDRVRTALHEYLSAHKFGNATTADLEASLTGSKPVLDSFSQSEPASPRSARNATTIIAHRANQHA